MDFEITMEGCKRRAAQELEHFDRPNTYVTREDATQYFDTYERSMRTMNDIIYNTTDLGVYQDALRLIQDGRAGQIAGYYGYVTHVKPQVSPMIGMETTFQIRIRPTMPPPTLRLDHLTRLNGNEAILPLIKEQRMKVYEAIVVKVNEKGEPTEVAKVVAPFVAANAEEAKSIVRVDYAQEHDLNGKDAAAIQVRVREFPLS